MNNNEIYHYGIKGMKWGIRRYQNKDGSLTPSGRQRYGATKGHIKKEIRQSSGKNLKTVVSRYRAEIDQSTTSTFNKLKLLNRKMMENPNDSSLEKQYRSIQQQLAKEVIPISKRYVEEFNEARLKDINYSNVELGKQMLKDYDLNFKVGNLSDGVLGRIIENGRFGVKVY